MTFISKETKTELLRLYEQPGRFYHGANHVYALLALFKQAEPLISDPRAVEAAIWFHDCIYDSTSKDNEARSAELAVARLSNTVDAERLSRIRAMIEATASHELPPFADPRAVQDAALFLDMDLAVLGADQREFDEYEAAVRQEYSWASDDAWNKGRAAVLTKFLERPHIYHSSFFREQFEQRARDNMKRSVQRLQGISAGQ